MVPAARARRLSFLSLVGALLAWSGLPRCGVLFQEAEIEGGGARQMARKVKAVRAIARFLSQQLPNEVGNSFDSNAIAESYGTSAMHHWVDRAGAAASAERLEAELMGMKIGRKAGTERRRWAMHARRLARQRQLQNRQSRPENGMLHWADRPAAIASPQHLEEQLASMTIGGLSGVEGRRGAARLRRLARERAQRGERFHRFAPDASVKAKAAPAASATPWRRKVALASSQYDTNAIGESFRGASSGGDLAREDAQHVEQELVALKIGGEAGTEGRRQAMRLRRMQRQ